jgi:hypothetical protein
MQAWPNDLFDFAWFPDRDSQFKELAQLSEDEDWEYHNSENPGGYEAPILFNYIRYTYRRIANERKIGLSDNGDFACFNTGLVTPNQEPFFASFEVNHRQDAQQQWYFKGWFRRGQWELNAFPELPELARYFDDPAVLVFDARKDFRVNVEHIIEDSRERFPPPYDGMASFALRNSFNGAIESAKERVRRNYKAAIPQFYNEQVQLLLPICLTDPQRADLALALEIHRDFYRATTCLTLDMAYNNARQLAKPDRDWLQP